MEDHVHHIAFIHNSYTLYTSATITIYFMPLQKNAPVVSVVALFTISGCGSRYRPGARTIAGYSFLHTSCSPQHAPSLGPADDNPVMAAAAVSLILF